MNRSIACFCFLLISGSSLGLSGRSVRADIVLEQYEFQGQPGTQTTLSPSLLALGISGLNFSTGSALTPSAGVNSMNASGWNSTSASAYFSFGLGVSAGKTVTVDQIILSTRSSNTGPGFISLEASVDGGALQLVASITQPSTTVNGGYVDQMLAITPVTASKSLVFYFVTTNQTSATGGVIGSGGTFRVGDYNPSGTATPFTINGTIGTAAVPEPATLVLTTFWLVGLGVGARLWRRVS